MRDRGAWWEYSSANRCPWNFYKLCNILRSGPDAEGQCDVSGALGLVGDYYHAFHRGAAVSEFHLMIELLDQRNIRHSRRSLELKKEIF